MIVVVLQLSKPNSIFTNFCIVLHFLVFIYSDDFIAFKDRILMLYILMCYYLLLRYSYSLFRSRTSLPFIDLIICYKDCCILSHACYCRPVSFL